MRLPNLVSWLVISATVLLFTTAVATADTWAQPVPMRYQSESGDYVFAVTPDPKFSLRFGYCKGELFRVAGGKEKLVWSRYLINNRAPLNAYVSNSGRYVVTLDEHGEVGKLPLVIYGLRGELIRVHSVESLGLNADRAHIRQTVSSFWWSANSIGFFGPEDETFVIRLHWGKLLMLGLRRGNLMDDEWFESCKGWLIKEQEWKDLHSYAERRSAELCLALLDSKEPEDRQTGAIVAGQMKLRKAVPRLRELLNDNADQSVGVLMRRDFFVRRAAEQALAEIEKPASQSAPATQDTH